MGTYESTKAFLKHHVLGRVLGLVALLVLPLLALVGASMKANNQTWDMADEAEGLFAAIERPLHMIVFGGLY